MRFKTVEGLRVNLPIQGIRSLEEKVDGIQGYFHNGKSFRVGYLGAGHYDWTVTESVFWTLCEIYL